MSQNEKPTIMDIARITGLSKGTVDRVLHNRGEVSKKSYAKVMAAIDELGYEPNLYASLLARGSARSVALLIPVHGRGSFWSVAVAGVEKAKEIVGPLGIDVEVFEYDQRDIASFRSTGQKMLESEPAGVVLAPMFGDETKMLIDNMKKRGIPYVFFDSKIEDDGYLAYFGLPEFKSGYLCGDQLTGGLPVDEVLVVRLQRDPLRQSDPTVNRRAGFKAYLEEHNPDCIVRSLFVDPDDPDRTDQELSAFFAAFPGTHHIAMFNSRIHLIVPWLERNPALARRVVGFDNLDANIAALRRGTVSTLIAQHPDEQVSLAVQALSEHIVFGKNPVRRDNYMHMDILTRYNAEYY